jgi:hypothetical protein
MAAKARFKGEEAPGAPALPPPLALASGSQGDGCFRAGAAFRGEKGPGNMPLWPVRFILKTGRGRASPGGTEWGALVGAAPLLAMAGVVAVVESASPRFG